MQNKFQVITVMSNRYHEDHQNCTYCLQHLVPCFLGTTIFEALVARLVYMLEKKKEYIYFSSISLFRKSLPRCRRINRMLSNESTPPPAFSRSNSQASMDSTSMEDFWCEVESIKESSEDGPEEATLLEFKPADGKHMNTTSSSHLGFALSDS